MMGLPTKIFGSRVIRVCQSIISSVIQCLHYIMSYRDETDIRACLEFAGDRDHRLVASVSAA
ncbi:hypothetical protein [Nostoc sp. CENA543]|uniref:hypothetical protein n=1 Tax=Nostoc sp. CENA543 TaxID=1869241 RepID=UPI0035B51432